MLEARRVGGWITGLIVAVACGCGTANVGALPRDGATADGAHDASVAHDVVVDTPTVDAHPADAADAATPADAAHDASTGGPYTCTGTGADPYPELTTPGDYTEPSDCASGACPAAFSGFTATPNSDNSVVQIAGIATGASSCRFIVVNTSSGLEEGTLATDPDGGGQFIGAVPLFCGANRVEIVCCADHGNRVKVIEFDGRACAGDDLRLTLTWDDSVRDGELHLIQSGYTINNAMHDCTWTTCIPPRVLDWGTPGDTTDNPVKDVDNTSTDGTEHVTLTRAPSGAYAIMAEHWNAGGLPGAMTMQINVQGHAPIVRTTPSIAAHWVWYVGQITFPGGAFVASDAMAPPHTPPLTDCTAPAWSSPGCGLPIPQ